jgi:hypothetical protein
MGVMLNIFIFYMGSFYTQVVALCKNVPCYSGRKSLFNIFSDISVMLGLGGSTILLFLLWGLTYLALAQTVAWIVFAILTYKSLFKPFYKRKESVQNGLDEG